METALSEAAPPLALMPLAFRLSGGPRVRVRPLLWLVPRLEVPALLRRAGLAWGPWLPERKELVPVAVPPAPGRGGGSCAAGSLQPPQAWAETQVPCGTQPPGSSRPRPSFPCLVLGFASPEGGQLPSLPGSVGQTHALQSGACAFMSVRPVTVRYTTLGKSLKLSQPLFSPL